MAGNHDPGGRTYRGGRIEWPESFHYIGGREPVSFEVLGDGDDSAVKIVGAGHTTAREGANIARAFPDADGRYPHIGLLHSYVTSADEVDAHDRYAPCSLEDLRRPGYKYWALGHIHRRQQVCEVTEAWYPGNVQGRNPRETGPKGGLLVKLDGSSRATVEFRRFAPIQWLDLQVEELEDAHTLPELEHRIRAEFERKCEADDGVGDGCDFLLRITLAGRSPLASELQSDDGKTELEELLGSSLDVLDVDVRISSVTRPVDIERHRGEPHLLGAVLKLIEEAEHDGELLRSLCPKVLARNPKDPEGRLAYLSKLLAGLDAEAAARLVQEG